VRNCEACTAILAGITPEASEVATKIDTSPPPPKPAPQQPTVPPPPAPQSYKNMKTLTNETTSIDDKAWSPAANDRIRKNENAIIAKYNIKKPDIGEIKEAIFDVTGGLTEGWVIGAGLVLILLVVSIVDRGITHTYTLVTAAVLLLFILFCFLKSKTLKCGFVGTLGFSYIDISKKSKQVIREETYLFKNMTTLCFPKTDVYYNGRKDHTDFTFTFYNNKNEKVFERSTSSKCYDWKLLEAIEIQWTLFILCDMIEQYNQLGSISFAEDVKIGNEYFSIGGTKYRKDDIQKYYFKDGTFGFFVNGNKKEIQMNIFPNQRAFLVLLNKLVLQNE
jgi:hypothetical protein